MDSHTFEVLEEKINHILSILDRLKNENQKLRQRNQELQSLVDEKDQQIQTYKEETKQQKDIRTEIDSYKENDDRIRSKIENLLQKLKEFEDIQ